MYKKKGIVKNFAKFTRKHLCLNLFFNKDAGLRSSESSDLLLLLQNIVRHIVIFAFTKIFNAWLISEMYNFKSKSDSMFFCQLFAFIITKADHRFWFLSKSSM